MWQRNVRPESVSSSGFTLLKGCWILLLASIGMGMGYLWIQSRIMDAGWKAKNLEVKLNQLQDHAAMLEVKLAKLKDPATVKARLDEKKLDLVSPRRDQIIMISQGKGLLPDKARQPVQSRNLVLLSVVP